MSMVRETFTMDTTGAMFYPALSKRIVELTMPALALKPLLQELVIRVGATAAIPKQAGQRTVAVVGRTEEGAQIVSDYTPYTVVTVTPYKVGTAIRITRELLEDQIVNIIEDQLRRAARRLVMTIDQDVEAAFNSAALTTSTFSATGTSIFMDGTSATRSGTIGVNDITNAKAIIQQYALEPDTIVMNPLQHQDLMALPQFAAYLFSNVPIYTQGSGTVPTPTPTLFGLKQIVTPNVPAGRAYVLAAAGANASGAYAPLGFFVVKRPISVAVWPQPNFDSIDVIVTARYAPVITYPESIVKMIGLRSS
jgi:HK97 family phage major capsid protein